MAGMAGRGAARHGTVMQAWLGMVWRGVAMQGNAGEDGYGIAMRGWARQARHGGAMRGWARQGRQGTAWRGNAMLGVAGNAGHAMQMATGKDPWQPGKTGNILTTPKGKKGRARNEKQHNQLRGECLY